MKSDTNRLIFKLSVCKLVGILEIIENIKSYVEKKSLNQNIFVIKIVMFFFYIFTIALHEGLAFKSLHVNRDCGNIYL